MIVDLMHFAINFVDACMHPCILPQPPSDHVGSRLGFQHKEIGCSKLVIQQKPGVLWNIEAHRLSVILRCKPIEKVKRQQQFLISGVHVLWSDAEILALALNISW